MRLRGLRNGPRYAPSLQPRHVGYQCVLDVLPLLEVTRECSLSTLCFLEALDVSAAVLPQLEEADPHGTRSRGAGLVLLPDHLASPFDESQAVLRTALEVKHRARGPGVLAPNEHAGRGDVDSHRLYKLVAALEL